MTEPEIKPSPSANAPSRAGAEAAWDWRSSTNPGGPGSVARPPTAAIRARAALQALVGVAVGAAVFFWRPPLAYVVWSITALVLLAALVSPHGLFAGISRAMAWLGRAVGQVLTVVLLVPLYYLFFALFGALFRRGRRDRMERWFDPRVGSYWKSRQDRPRTIDRYKRLF